MSVGVPALLALGHEPLSRGVEMCTDSRQQASQRCISTRALAAAGCQRGWSACFPPHLVDVAAQNALQRVENQVLTLRDRNEETLTPCRDTNSLCEHFSSQPSLAKSTICQDRLGTRRKNDRTAPVGARVMSHAMRRGDHMHSPMVKTTSHTTNPCARVIASSAGQRQKVPEIKQPPAAAAG